MTDDTHLATRRTALKGLAAFAGTSAVGAGALIHASEPVAAVEHEMTIDDIVIQSADGAISEFGFSDMWFEVSYENISNGLSCVPEIVAMAPQTMEGRYGTGRFELGVAGKGSETFGYGDKFQASYTVDLSEHAPDHFPLVTNDEDFLDTFSLANNEDEKAIDVELQFRLDHIQDDGDSFEPLSFHYSKFQVTVERVESTGEVSGGEGDAYGED